MLVSCIIYYQRMEAAINKQLKIKLYINLDEKNVNDAGAEYLFAQKIQVTKRIWLCNNQITAIGMLGFSKVEWKSLEFLSLRNNMIGDKGCKYITRANCQHLQTIHLPNNKIGSGGVLHLSKKNWPRLKNLYLASNKLSDSSGKWLTKAKWPDIKAIGLSQNKMGFIEMINIILLDAQLYQDVSHDQNLTYLDERFQIKKLMNKKMGFKDRFIQELYQ